MKTVSLFFAGALLCATAIAAAADAPRLALWITDSIGATNGSKCRFPNAAVSLRLPTTTPTLTEQDVIAWNANQGRWTLAPDRFPVSAAFDKLQDRCFVLAIDDKLAASGVVLASYSARLIDFPAISVINQKDKLDLQLTSTFHGSFMHPIQTEALNAVLGQPANLQVQLKHAAAQGNLPASDPSAGYALSSGQAWIAAVQKMVEHNEIREGMPIADAIKHLGPPTRVSPSADNKGAARYYWYFATPLHVNPLFEIWTEDDIVRGFRTSRG